MKKYILISYHFVLGNRTFFLYTKPIWNAKVPNLTWKWVQFLEKLGLFSKENQSVIAAAEK